MPLRCWMVACLLAVVLATAVCSSVVAQAPDTTGRPTNLFFEAAYLRETSDRPWHFRITGNVPSLPGCYVIVHDADERVLLQHHVPHGRYTSEEPHMIAMPADGIIGDYRVIIVGFQNDTLEMNLPLTDLPLEVYGRRWFAAPSHTRFPFRVPEGVAKLTFSAYGGGSSLRVLENDQTLLDVKEQGTLQGRNIVAATPVRAGVNYELQPYGTFYFGVEEGIFLATDMRRWFYPNPKLDEVKWWQRID